MHVLIPLQLVNSSSKMISCLKCILFLFRPSEVTDESSLKTVDSGVSLKKPKPAGSEYSTSCLKSYLKTLWNWPFIDCWTQYFSCVLLWTLRSCSSSTGQLWVPKFAHNQKQKGGVLHPNMQPYIICIVHSLSPIVLFRLVKWRVFPEVFSEFVTMSSGHWSF